MEKSEPAIQLPNNIEGISIHLSYIRKDIDTISRKLDALSGQFVTNTDFQEHMKVSDDHEKRIRAGEVFKNNLDGRMWGIGAIVSLVMGTVVILINHFFK